ncbi:MAG TPA: RES domain-containing protein [Tepidiformaceae bacterium]|nr:RES domain-containing protein [Tepidiformaceae bacterium]
MHPSPDVLAALDGLEPTGFEGTCYRWTSPDRQPLSGTGARLMGGRWNPVGVPAIYLAQPEAACVAEFTKVAESQPGGRTGFLRPIVHEVYVEGLTVLNLRTNATRAAVGLSLAAIMAPDHTACREVGYAASYLGVHAIVAPSSTGVGSVVAVYELNIRPAQLTVVRSYPLPE